MAENEIVRKKGLVSLVLLLVLVCPDAGAQGVSWNRTMMDGSRTGCTSPLSDNVEQSIGVVKGRRYYAPNGRVFRGGTVGKVARVVSEAQPSMAVVKTVIGRSSAEMIRHKPECALFDWFADLVMVQVAGLAGKPVDVSIVNSGGVRIDMPEGNILLDDIRSMFPFKNELVLVRLKGSVLRKHFEEMVSERNFQPFSGAQLTVGDGRIKELLIGGEPVRDERIYNLATISFLLDGGDKLYLSREAESVTIFPVQVADAVIGYIKSEAAAGRDIAHEESYRLIFSDSGPVSK